MGFRDNLKVDKPEPNKKMLEAIDARKSRKVSPSNEKTMEAIDARKSKNCPEYDGDEI